MRCMAFLYLEEDRSDIEVSLAEVQVSSGKDKETGIEDGEQCDVSDIRLESADEDKKEAQPPGKEPNALV